MLLYPNIDLQKVTNSSHPIFKFVEQQFFNWIENANPAGEYHEKYFSDEAIYTKHGAITQAIENAAEEANETNRPVDLSTFDYDAAFGD